ncbi:MAG: Cell division protein FtsZ, partial [Bacteroidota bacterium]|nr:Cell division protein FtsZ [Bacteroidota bacterium]
MPIELDTTSTYGAKLRVIGVGGGGGNTINNMVESGIIGVDFIVANTDAQALSKSIANIVMQVGKDTTRGLGAGANPEVGKKAFDESQDEIREALKGSDMIFITTGMGGGTGTGGAPVVAKIGKEINALVVGIVTKPFKWEGSKRCRVAEEGIKELSQHVDALIVIPNYKVFDVIEKNTGYKEAFKKVDEVLYNATRGIAEIITNPGHINVDFADVKTIMTGMGHALMGIGKSSGEHRAIEAAQDALNSNLLEGVSIAGSKGVLINISGNNIGMNEIDEIMTYIEHEVGEDANIKMGLADCEDLRDELMVTVVATGFKSKEQDKPVVTVAEEMPKIAKTNNQNGMFPKQYYNPNTNIFQHTLVTNPPSEDKYAAIR